VFDEEDLPVCPSGQIVSFNLFGQPVCYCDGDSFFLDDLSTAPDASKQCYKEYDNTPCTGEFLASFSENYITMRPFIKLSPSALVQG
jgi:hypothetical protein